jgi:hypothetical protein
METFLIKSNFCKRVTGKLYEHRTALGMSTNKVREQTDIDVNKIENNESNLSVFTLYTLLKFYGKSMGEFFTEMEQEPANAGPVRERQILDTR